MWDVFCYVIMILVCSSSIYYSWRYLASRNFEAFVSEDGEYEHAATYSIICGVLWPIGVPIILFVATICFVFNKINKKFR